jgi:REP element-mobilizing transposase RayT
MGTRYRGGAECRQDAGGTECRQDAGGTEGRPDGGGTKGEHDAGGAKEGDRALLCGIHDRGYLPHWKGEGATYFVTFRLCDSLPQAVLRQFEAEREEILQRERTHGRMVSAVEKRRLAELFSERIEAYLDAGHGACWLRRPELADLVAQALPHFAGTRYELFAWVVMPNHVHVVVAPREIHTLSSILHSWKSYTANEANKRLNRVGQPFWQHEAYDHRVRDEEEFVRVCAYVERNPVTAGLCRQPEEWRWSSAYGVRGF